MYHGLVVVHYEALQRPSLGPERRQLVANTPNLQPSTTFLVSCQGWARNALGPVSPGMRQVQ